MNVTPNSREAIYQSNIKVIYLQASSREDAIKKADEINEKLHHTDQKTYGFAKAVFIKENQDYELGKWHIQVTHLAPTNFDGTSWFLSLVNGQLSLEIKCRDILNKIEFIDLINYAKELLDCIESKQNGVARPLEIKRKLHKFILLLSQTNKWPYSKTESSVENVVKAFANYIKCFKENHLSVQNQITFSGFLSDLNKQLNQQVMVLEGFSFKILTKANRSFFMGSKAFEKIRKLLEVGTERIFWPKQEVPEKCEKVVGFSLVFASQVYVYKPNVDNVDARVALKVQIDRLIQLLVAYDRDQTTFALFEFTQGLLQHIEIYLEKGGSWRQKAAPLLWTLENMVKNPEFIGYMQANGAKVESLTDLLSLLFLKSETWQPIADFIVFLGNQKLFSHVFEKRIYPSLKLNQKQIDVIFFNLNQKLSEKNKIFGDEYMVMYLYFLESLAKNNKLHFLKPYAQQEQTHQSHLRQNLVDLDYSFMKKRALPLEWFFGNATFNALNYKSLPTEMLIKRLLLKLFSRCGDNPVGDPTSFENNLISLLDDFNQGYIFLPEQILSKLGDLVKIGKGKNENPLVPVDGWLQSIQDLYDSLKEYILKCLPLKWEEEVLNYRSPPHDKVCFYKGKLYTIKASKDGELHLVELISKRTAGPRKGVGMKLSSLLERASNEKESEDKKELAPLFTSIVYEEMKDILNESLQIEAVQNGVAALIEAYVSFHNQPKIKEEIEKMLNLIFEKMHKEYLVTFDERLTILSNFLQALSPFLKKLDSLVEKRFFKSDGTIKNHVLNHLIVEAVKLKCTFLEETELGDATLQENVPKEKKLIEDLSKVTAFVCHSEIEKVIQPCSLPGLVSATSQFESVVCRRIDQLSYTDEEFIQAFCNHANNQAQRQAENDLPDILANLTQNKEQIFADYREFLQQRTIPINFILPNQALAVQLCRCPQLDNRHLLIKLGTGQGKSLVIALAAIHEAKKIQKSGEFVLVLTSYDHLAKRDHEFGSHFFRKDNIESICISEINHVTTSFHPNVKIIYADIETLDDIIRKIMLKLLENREGNKPTSQEKEFIKAIYDAGKRLSVILDEYDLLLCDYEEKTPFCDVVGTSFLPVQKVAQYRNYFTYLADLVGNPQDVEDQNAIDPHTGNEYRTVGRYNSRYAYYNLNVAVFRLSQLLKRANRVIGLSGTAIQGERHSLENPLFFEIPSSQNPEVFGTEIQQEPNIPPKSESYISCHQKVSFPITRKINEKLWIVPESSIKGYCDAIIRDIKEIREEQETESMVYERPILIFVHPYLKYKVTENSEEKRLWNTVKDAIRDAGLQVHLLPPNVQDADFQTIAQSGKITQATIKNGRGADIRVSLDIEEGLHVSVGTSTSNDRLLRQLIGRTGRMGRKGSYSAITLGELIDPPPPHQLSQADFYNALHQLTEFFVKRLASARGCTVELCQKWILFLTRSYSAQSINESHARELCGEFYQKVWN